MGMSAHHGLLYDFSQKKNTIDKIYSITSAINIFGILLGIILIIVAILVVFNTIKLAIENSKEEIKQLKESGEKLAEDRLRRVPARL